MLLPRFILATSLTCISLAGCGAPGGSAAPAGASPDASPGGGSSRPDGGGTGQLQDGGTEGGGSACAAGVSIPRSQFISASTAFLRQAFGVETGFENGTVSYGE